MPFAKLGLPPLIVKGVRAAGYNQPTPIQQRAIPIVLEGHDLVAAAQTGTGKTAAFVLPILARLLEGHPALRALVLVPTRELAAQVETNARDYARFTRLRAGVAYGGVPIGPQERLLRHEGVDLLVATPGRLLDLHGRQSVSLEDVEILVLDEADRMVDMGFAPDLKRILRLLPTRRQTLMFSATMPPELNKVAKESLRNPQRVDLAPPSRPAAGITQAIYPVPRHLKTDLLDELMSRSDVGSAIVFTRTKHGADRLTRQLEKRGHSVAALHGDRTQSQRERALAGLRRGRVQILVATDIASRGIDVEDISHVVNFDVPHTPEDYVHRIGRTGRVEAVGDAFTLMSPEEQSDVTAIERFLGRSIPRVSLPDFDYHRRAEPGQGHGHGGERSGRGGRGRDRGRDGRPRDGWSRPSSSETGSPYAGGPGSENPAGPSHAAPSHGRRPVRNAPDRRRRRM
ncbi:MAG TPA: DEAD/DEAH box helicase [Candidatus Sulfotelmatobacter sp.]|nr:DEAD/DEAH box helicase [Candidatus Sulfotelmatobacter sp.]